MPITIGVDTQRTLIRAHLEGESCLLDMTRALRKVLDIVAEGGPTQILVDARRHNHAPIFDLIEIMREIPHSLRIAVIMSEKSQSDVRFAKTQGDRRNLPFNVFWSEEEALSWLRGDP